MSTVGRCRSALLCVQQFLQDIHIKTPYIKEHGGTYERVFKMTIFFLKNWERSQSQTLIRSILSPLLSYTSFSFLNSRNQHYSRVQTRCLRISLIEYSFLRILSILSFLSCIRNDNISVRK